jgi:general secretion pathway protein E
MTSAAVLHPGTPPRVAGSETAPSSAEAEHGAGPSRAVFERFVEVPAFQRLLTEGAEAIYRLPPALQDDLVALDLGAFRALVIARAGQAPQSSVHLQARSLRAQLRTAQYQVQEREATLAVIREIRRHPGQFDQAASSAKPLTLFNAWLECAESMDATDLHVEIRGNLALVRVRVDGELIVLADPAGGRYSRAEAENAVAAGFNATRKGNTGPHYAPEQFVNCMIGFDTPRTAGQARFQNLPGRLGPKVVVRLLRMRTGGAA